jgi:TonB family protein
MKGTDYLFRTAFATSLLSAGAMAATPTPVRPVGSPGNWIGSEDYPVSALRSMAEGLTRFRLDVNAEGHVAGCTIVQPSGTDALDTATCALLSARASFTPATDRKGRPIVSSYTSSVRWQVPDNGGEAAARAHFETCRFGSADAIIVETAFGCTS